MMSSAPTCLPDASPSNVDHDMLVGHVVAELTAALGVEFSIWDADHGEPVHVSGSQGWMREGMIGNLVRAMAGRSEPEFLLDCDCLLVLAIQLPLARDASLVAVGAFATRRVQDAADVADAAHVLAMPEPVLFNWINRQSTWTADGIIRVAKAVMKQLAAEAKARSLSHQVEQLSKNIAHTYEEISLLYLLTTNLRISSTDDNLGRLALDWLSECVAAKGFVIQYSPVAEDGEANYEARTEPVLISKGDCPLDCDQLTEIVEALELTAASEAYVANYESASGMTLPPPAFARKTLPVLAGIEQMIIVPLAEGDNLFGWIAAFNHRDGEEFGTVEASLLKSVGTILGIHSGNRELYRQQRETLANFVKALSSAIDAKDPYTCGHSDRVARVSVRLAKELGCDTETLSTLYIAGLLHDVGKIGIDENVLRKPGRLTDAEYEHIKLHPELGHKILADIKQLADILPVVLHHHEQWDGCGYPHGIAGEEIPLLARIAAVADAYDAMSSDRPYRDGMPDEKVDSILQSGAGSQWDERVVEAFFAARDDIREIGNDERKTLSLDVRQWT